MDHLFTGKVERVDTELLQTLLNQGIVPVVLPLGFSGDGKTYRTNSDSVALAVADTLKATKLIYVTAQDGLRYQDQMIRQMLVADGRNFYSPHAGDSSRKWFPRRATRRPPAPRASSASTSSTAAWTKACSPSVLQRRHRHAHLRQRVPTDPAGQEEGRPRNSEVTKRPWSRGAHAADPGRD